MLLAELVALAVMTALGTLLAPDTGPGRAVLYAIQRQRRHRRMRRFADRAPIAPRRAA
jgi:hypothetical protein